jgi:hypothetical protein
MADKYRRVELLTEKGPDNEFKIKKWENLARTV